MAVRKATRSNSTAQHTLKTRQQPSLQPRPQRKPQHPKLDTKYHTHPHHLETELFDTLRQFNLAFGTALCALEKIDTRFSGPHVARNGLRQDVRGVVREYGGRIGELRAEANRELFRALAGVEERSAAGFNRLQHSRG